MNKRQRKKQATQRERVAFEHHVEELQDASRSREAWKAYVDCLPSMTLTLGARTAPGERTVRFSVNGKEVYQCMGTIFEAEPHEFGLLRLRIAARQAEGDQRPC